MSAPAKAAEKPKRPLSGYNLFYRWKRTKVMEATERFFPSGATSSEEEKEVIAGILRALPGLEGVPASHPIWSLPPQVRNEIRSSNIRSVMASKLLPNNQTRSRLHRKSHGMGFVEFGKLMREMYASLDKVSKDVFNELADVGRVTYRKKLAEYKLQLHSGSLSNAEEVMRQSASYEMPKVLDFCRAMPPPATSAVVNVEATPQTTKRVVDVPAFVSFVSPVSSHHMTSSPGVVLCQAVSPAQDLGALEPIPISPTSATSPKTVFESFGRRVTNDQFSSDIVKSSIQACQEIGGRFGSIPPPPLFQAGESRTDSSSDEDELDGEDMLKLLDSLDDMMDDSLDHLLDDHCDDKLKGDASGPSMIFGQPVHDVQRTAVASSFQKRSTMNNVAALAA